MRKEKTLGSRLPFLSPLRTRGSRVVFFANEKKRTLDPIIAWIPDYKCQGQAIFNREYYR